MKEDILKIIKNNAVMSDKEFKIVSEKVSKVLYDDLVDLILDAVDENVELFEHELLVIQSELEKYTR